MGILDIFAVLLCSLTGGKIFVSIAFEIKSFATSASSDTRTESVRRYVMIPTVPCPFMSTPHRAAELYALSLKSENSKPLKPPAAKYWS